MAKKTVRILRQLPVDGVLYRPDQLVAFEAKEAAQYIDAGAADSKKPGIDHCKSIGVEVVTHTVPEEVQAERDAEAKAAEEKAAQEAADAETKAAEEKAAQEAVDAETKAAEEKAAQEAADLAGDGATVD
ncbi:MAG: hypothetical protein AB9Q17_02295 [Candidatus Reddybacter sp.]